MEETPNIDLRAAEELAADLGDALSFGDGPEAERLCRRLAQLAVPVTVNICAGAYPQDQIRLRVGVEDAQSDAYIPITVVVTSGMTIAQLKDQISRDYKFPPALQRWVIGKRLARDNDTLHSHGIRQSGDQAFLFILSADNANLTRQQHKLDQEQQRLEGIMEVMQLSARGKGGGEKPLLTAPPVPPKNQVGWVCPRCTFLNRPTRPGCEICSGDRPEDYEVPDIYRPDEVLRLEQEEIAMMLYEQGQQEERDRNYMDLLEMDGMDLIANTTELDCPVCFSSLPPGEGIVLRECLHTFCRDCLKGMVVNSQDAEVSCPEACESKLLDREIKALLTEEEHQRFLELRLIIAERRSDHSFHCQTPNCRGWCIYEDEVNDFHCEICNAVNCILCRAIHKGMNCKDYQDDLRIRAENDLAAKQTRQMLENVLLNGEAMNCPKCDIIIQKKDGCDWLCCVMCMTEICWVTKQARWGPKGNGDTSGGCRCRVNNQPCHPNCQNCH